MKRRRWSGWVLGMALVVFLALPLIALTTSVSPAEVVAGLRSPEFATALWLSVRTTLVALTVTVVLGTPLAWLLASGSSRW